MFSGPLYRDDQLGVDHFKEFENQIDGWLQNNRDIVQARSLTNLSDTEVICQLLQKIDPRSFSKYHRHVGDDVAKKNGNILAIGQFSFKLGVPFDFLLTTRDFELNNKKAFYRFLGVILYIGGVLTTWDCPATILSKSFYFTNYLGDNLDLQVPEYSKLDNFVSPDNNMNFKLCLRELYPNWILTYAIAKDIRKHLRSIKKDDSTLKYLAATSRSSSVVSSRSNSRIPSRKMSFSISNDQDQIIPSSQVIPSSQGLSDSRMQFTAQTQIRSASKHNDTQNINQQTVLSKTKNFHSSLITDENTKVYGMGNAIQSVMPKPPSMIDNSPPNKVIPVYSQNPNSNQSMLDNSFSTRNLTNSSGVNKSIHNESGVNKSINNGSDVNKSIHNKSGVNKSIINVSQGNSNPINDQSINTSIRDSQVNKSIHVTNKTNNSINKSSLQNTNPNMTKNTDISELDTEIEEITQDQYDRNNSEFDYTQQGIQNIYGNHNMTNQDITGGNTDNGDASQNRTNNNESIFNDPSSISIIPEESQTIDHNDQYYNSNDPNDPNNQYYNQDDPNNQYYNPNDPNDPYNQYYNPNDPNDPNNQYYNPNDPNDPNNQYYNPNDPNDPYNQYYNQNDPAVTDYQGGNPNARPIGESYNNQDAYKLYNTGNINHSNLNNYSQNINQSGLNNNYTQANTQGELYVLDDEQDKYNNTGSRDEISAMDTTDPSNDDTSNITSSDYNHVGNTNGTRHNPTNTDNSNPNTTNNNQTGSLQPKPVEPSTCCLIY